MIERESRVIKREGSQSHLDK